MATERFWQPPDFNRPESGRLGEIQELFSELYPSNPYGDLAARISEYWISKLRRIWADKSENIKTKDLKHDPNDPLSRIEHKTVLISYADSVRENRKPTLKSLERFLGFHFPAIRGLHILPPCEMSEQRFNDGGFSQIQRNRIHSPFGTNKQFEAMMEKFYSMTDFVLNHVDIEHPKFQQYLNGEDRAGNCFFVFSEPEYQKRSAMGDFEQIFRPRPFPLFTIFRRKPRGAFAAQSHDEKITALNNRFRYQGLEALPNDVNNILFIFTKIANDQMLLTEDHQYVTRFRKYLMNDIAMDPDLLFVVSKTQETRDIAYIFNANIQCREDFLSTILPRLGISAEKAALYVKIYETNDAELFGEPIRALTTFSHVQVDLNTSTYEGLKLLIDDFAWYLEMDLNMLRLDAANYAFKKWGSSCFGLPEVRKLLKILYLTMDAVSPRNVPNLEVNAPLGDILKQMADKQAPPPMMYDFHLASMLPVAFNAGDARPLLEIFNLIRQYDIPHESIRFSLDESHDGKSVSGSGGADSLLTYAQRQTLVDIVIANNGYVKYKSSPKRRYSLAEFKKICFESGLHLNEATKALFKKSVGTEILRLKEEIQSSADIARALNVDIGRFEKEAALVFFVDKIIHGREPYELCITTRDVLTKLDNPVLEVKRYMAFKTLALALMGRNVKAVYFNDLMGLKNDYELANKTGELRNIKRTKSDRIQLEQLISEPSNAEYWIAKQMNNVIALVDSDPAFHPRGNEARLVVDPAQPSIATLHNSFQNNHTLIIVNTSNTTRQIQIRVPDYGLERQKDLIDHISGVAIPNDSGNETITLAAKPFDRFWIKNKKIEFDHELLVEVGSEEEMTTALTI